MGALGSGCPRERKIWCDMALSLDTVFSLDTALSLKGGAGDAFDQRFKQRTSSITVSAATASFWRDLLYHEPVYPEPVSTT